MERVKKQVETCPQSELRVYPFAIFQDLDKQGQSRKVEVGLGAEPGPVPQHGGAGC